MKLFMNARARRFYFDTFFAKALLAEKCGVSVKHLTVCETVGL